MKPEGAQQLDWRNPWIYIIVGVLLSLVISPAHLVAFVFAAFFAARSREWLPFAISIFLILLPLVMMLVIGMESV